MPSTVRSKNFVDISHVDNVQKQTLKRFLWLKHNFVYCLILSAVVWGVAFCYYVQNFIGWNSVLSLAPVDFTILVLAVIFPVLILWFLLAYIERTASLDANTQLLQSYINNLMYPDEEASISAKAIASALQDQVKLLHKESQNVLNQSAKIKADLELRITEMSDILKLLDDYSAKTLLALNDGVKDLANRCSYITDKTTHSAQQLKDCSEDIVQNSDKFLSKLSPILDEVSALSSNIKNNIADNKSNLINIREQLNACSELSNQCVRDMLLKTDENTQKIEQSFYRTAEEYDHLYKKLDTSISSIEGRVEEQKRLIQSQTQVINHNSELLDNKLSKYGKTVSLEIDKLVKNSIELEKIAKKQISTLKAVNHETGAAVRGIGDVFDEKRMEIERRTEYAINSMQNVVIAINKETEKLLSFTNLTQAKNHDLQSIAETIVDKIGDVSNKLALKTDTLKDKAVEVIDKFNEASELIQRNTEKINKSSNLILNNSKQSVKLLEEQNFYINNALSNIDSVQSKLEDMRGGVKKISQSITGEILNNEQILQSVVPVNKVTPVEAEEPEYDREKLIAAVKTINRTLRNIGVNAEKLYEKQDVFGLWESYLAGKQNAFTEVLLKSLSHKHTQAIRKAFDDNADFHNQVIRYLFLMDMMIKDMLNDAGSIRDDLVNFAVNQSLDKIYFILVKALNSAE